MRVADDPELAGWLSRAEAEAFVEQLGVRFERPDLEALRALLRAYLGKLPFQNIGMLARYGRAPTRAEILDDMRRARGGPCNVMNPFFAALLARLGYEVRLLSGSMKQPDCHIALLVELSGRGYWVDAGNGHPYLEPVAFGDEEPRSYAGLTFRLTTRPEPATYAVEHLFPGATAWTTSYLLTLAPRPLRDFAEMIEQHHTRPGFGPFLLGLRLIRFPDGALTAIRDDVLMLGRASIQTARLPDRGALLRAVAEHFGDIDLPVEEALRALEQAGRPLFGAPSQDLGAQP
jgi:arylamine N-acetyltransferase